MVRTIAPAWVAALVLGSTSVQAQPARQDATQDTRDVSQGRVFAQRVCATCHGIQLGQVSAVAGAPNFYTIASTPGMSPLALRVVLETPHHSMPNFPFSDQERRSVIAYILSLRPREGR